jgi:hypothetical protein
MPKEKPPTLEQLANEWKIHKAAERAANEKRLLVESKIVDMIGNELPDKGTYNCLGILKITTGFNEKWDQQVLADIVQDPVWTLDVPFPFVPEWKPTNSAIKHYRDNVPEVYAVLTTALRSDPKKPSFDTK